MEDCFRVYILHWPPFLCHSASVIIMETFPMSTIVKNQQNDDNLSCLNYNIVGRVVNGCLLFSNNISIIQCRIW